MAVVESRFTTLSPGESKRLVGRHPELADSESETPIVLALSTRDQAEAATLGDVVLAARQLLRERASTYEELLSALIPKDSLAVGPGVLEQARLNAEARTGLAREFGLLSSHDVASGAGSKAANAASLVSRWRKEDRVFAVDVDGTARYPGFQFGETGQALSVVGRVIEAADAHLSGWGLALWFTGSTGWLGGRRPVDVIDGPDEHLVVDAMRHLVAELP
jgi:hypothetical protein